MVMKGVILAGGRGTRLRPMTNVVNKHLLPVYDEPLIYYPINTLLNAGIDDILIISSPEYIGKYIELLEEDFDDVNFSYRVQNEPKGIAHAVSIAEDFVDDKFAVMLGDNIILGDLSDQITEFQESDSKAKIFLKEVDQPARYGIADIDSEGKVIDLEEKPENPSSNNAVIGLYLYDKDFFSKVDQIDPSDRGEYEITDVNNLYVKEGEMDSGLVENRWFDAGTPEGLFKASKYAREHKKSD
jgi:glucose-1-phosphate thymidylyltransferase